MFQFPFEYLQILLEYMLVENSDKVTLWDFSHERSCI